MKGVSIAVLSCMFFGLQPIFSKVLLDYMSPIALATLTSIISVSLLMFVLEIRHKIDEISRISKRDFTLLLVISVLSGVLAQLFFVTGLMQSTATNAVLITRMNSLLIALFGVIFLRERFTVHQLVGSVLMFAGVVLIVTKNLTETFQMTYGDGLLLLTAIFWAVSNTIVKKYLCQLSPEVLVIGRYGFAGLILLFFSVNEMPEVVTPQVIMYLIGLSVFVIVIGSYLWYYALEHTTAANVGLAGLTIPLFGVVYAVTLLGETLELYQLCGGALIILGLAAIEFHRGSVRNLECMIKNIHLPHH